MELNERNKDNKVYNQFKSSMDIGMGFMYMVISGYAMNTNFIIEKYGKSTVWTIAFLFIAYGLFRIYRGIQFYLKK
jgi:hypothetical protein